MQSAAGWFPRIRFGTCLPVGRLPNLTKHIIRNQSWFFWMPFLLIKFIRNKRSIILIEYFTMVNLIIHSFTHSLIHTLASPNLRFHSFIHCSIELFEYGIMNRDYWISKWTYYNNFCLNRIFYGSVVKKRVKNFWSPGRNLALWKRFLCVR